MVSRIEIDTVGDHKPKHCHMRVDGVGVLVDLAGIAGPAMDPFVEKIEWGPFGENYTQAGRIYRRSQSNASSLVEIKPFSDIGMLGPYLEAYKKRLAEALGK
jgi:hypothetical protein